MSILHRVEEYHTDGPGVILSFDTKAHGYWQCMYTESGLRELTTEPSIEMLTTEEREEVLRISKIVYALAFGIHRVGYD